MSYEIEFKMHNANTISLRDKDGDVDIANSKWDILFLKCCDISENIYFKGVRPYCESPEINSLLRSISNSSIFDPSLIKINPSILLISRKGLSSIWEHYEYPFLFFGSNDINEESLKKKFENDWEISTVMKSIVGCMVLYRSFEPDIIWLKKTSDLFFPIDFFHG